SSRRRQQGALVASSGNRTHNCLLGGQAPDDISSCDPPEKGRAFYSPDDRAGNPAGTLTTTSLLLNSFWRARGSHDHSSQSVSRTAPAHRCLVPPRPKAQVVPDRQCGAG